MSEKKQNINQVCRFCQRNSKLAYYCENCGISCCSDCLDEEKVDSFVCQECNSKNIDVINEGKKVCKECESENVIKVNQHIKSCPKCHSHNIINIYEKKEKLDQKFLELVTNSRKFINPFKEVINKLYLLREKVKNARDPPIRCYHFPKMESDLLSLFKLILYLEKTLLEKVSIHFHHLSLNKEYFFSIFNQPNENIRIIEGILDNLVRSYESIIEFVDENIETIISDTKSIEKNLNFIDKITGYFMEYKRFLNLTDEEKPIYAINAKLSNGLNNQEIFKKKSGMLFITNLDLSFIHEYGWIKKKQDLIFKAPVSDLIRIKEKGKIFKKLYIEFAYGKYEFSLPDNDAISRVIEYILLARSYDETAIFDKDSARKLKNMEINLKKLKNFIEEGINSFYSLKCQSNNSIRVDRNEYYQENTKASWNMGKNEPYPNKPPNHYNNYKFQPYNRYPESRGYNDGNYSHDQELRLSQTNHENNNQFYLQNLFNPNRFQNYNPDQYVHMYKPREEDFDRKAFLMKQLEKQQRLGPNDYNSFKNNDGLTRNYPINYPSMHRNYRPNNVHDYNKIHLSKYFDSDGPWEHNEINTENSDFKIDVPDCKEELRNLNREKFSLNETLKKLEDKFDQGIITEVDYFRTFKNLKKEIYQIEKNIEKLEKKIRKDESIRRIGRKFDKRKYFT
jgi:hypothetical protein